MKTVDDYRNFFAEVRKETGIEAMTPEDDAQRTVAAGILDDLMNDLAETTQNMQGAIVQRLGNEIMID